MAFHIGFFIVFFPVVFGHISQINDEIAYFSSQGITEKSSI
ncbi:hypothetical protein [Ectobacillus funiculus]|jgi:hypothetical protein|nr:hypothetical protein [Ectobacillus funiculus]